MEGGREGAAVQTPFPCRQRSSWDPVAKLRSHRRPSEMPPASGAARHPGYPFAAAQATPLSLIPPPHTHTPPKSLAGPGIRAALAARPPVSPAGHCAPKSSSSSLSHHPGCSRVSVSGPGCSKPGGSERGRSARGHLGTGNLALPGNSPGPCTAEERLFSVVSLHALFFIRLSKGPLDHWVCFGFCLFAFFSSEFSERNNYE